STGNLGNTIMITGQNFSGAAGHLSVSFGSAVASTVTVLSDTQISVVVPSGAGVVDVRVQSGVDETDNLSGNPNANVNAPIFGYGISATSTADEFTYRTLQSINVTPGNPSQSVGGTVTFTATGTYSDSSTHVIAAGVTWTSTNLAVATIDASGKATALGTGE